MNIIKEVNFKPIGVLWPPLPGAKLDFAGILAALPLMGTCTRGVATYLQLNFFSKDSNGYLYLRGPYNRGVLIIREYGIASVSHFL